MLSSIAGVYALLGLQVLAFHPVWRWYGIRLTYGSDEPWGLMALATALLLLVMDGTETDSDRKSLLVPALLTIVYAATYPFVPRLAQAAIAVMSIACTLSVLRSGRLPSAPILGLCALSVPVIPSLQFYGGYPLRVVSGTIASVLLNMSGLDVHRDGACLRWAGELVAIDAPCSGVRMLWVGLNLAFSVAAVSRPGYGRTIIVALAATVVVLLGNGIRSASLFHLETGLVKLPSWSHDAVGLVVFAFTGTAIAWMAHRMTGGARCVTHRSS